MKEIEELLEKQYCIIDILPLRVPENSPGKYFAVEEYLRTGEDSRKISEKFRNVVLKLWCYRDLEFVLPEEDRTIADMTPAEASDLLEGAGSGEGPSGDMGRKDLCILIGERAGKRALLSLNRGDLYMTLYGASPVLKKLCGALASSEGLFLREPKSEQARIKVKVTVKEIGK